MAYKTIPTITTIIPTYRRPKLLQRAIHSVLNQTYPYFQVCVYDNASGDETASIVKKLAKTDPRIKYHCHPKNIGTYNNFNYGIEQIKTDFFSFLSDDDIILPNFYKTALNGFKKFPEAVYSATGVILSDTQGNALGYCPTFIKDTNLYFPPKGLITILKYSHITWTGTLYRTKIIKDIGTIDKKVGIISDVDFQLRIAARFPFVVSPKPGAILTAHAHSLWTRIKIKDIWPGWLNMIKNITKDKYIPHEVRLYAKTILTKQIKKKLFLMGCNFILTKNYNETYKISQILNKHYHLKKRVFFLKTMIKICKYFPFVLHILILLNKLRKIIIWKNLKPLRKRYNTILYPYYKL